MYKSERRNPDIHMLNILANFFNVSVDYLLRRNSIRNNSTSEKELTIDLHSAYEYDELPDEAKKEIENFIEYIKIKYKDKYVLL